MNPHRRPHAQRERELDFQALREIGFLFMKLV